jgi:hypothetical protein
MGKVVRLVNGIPRSIEILHELPRKVVSSAEVPLVVNLQNGISGLRVSDSVMFLTSATGGNNVIVAPEPISLTPSEGTSFLVGQLLLLVGVGEGVTITSSGHTVLKKSTRLLDDKKTLQLMWSGTHWLEVTGDPGTAYDGPQITYFDASVLIGNEIGVGGTLYSADHTEVILPENETYNGTNASLRVEVNGVGQVEGVDYEYQYLVVANTVTFFTPVPQHALVRFAKENSSPSGNMGYYDISIPVTTEIGVSGTGYNVAHTTFTLPNAQTYDGTAAGDPLKLDLNGVGLLRGDDFSYEFDLAATTVIFNTPMPKGSRVRFIMIYPIAGTTYDYFDKNYEVTTEIGVAGSLWDADHLVLTLPNNETYNGTSADELLKVQVNGVGKARNIDYTYTFSEIATTVTVIAPIPKYSVVRFMKTI